MKAIYIDAFSGISGNMFLGALIDLGVPAKYLQEELAKLNLGKYEFRVSKVVKKGISCQYVDIHLTHDDHHHDEHAHHEHHHHRNLQDIMTIINASDLVLDVKSASAKVFTKLAEAEAKVHGTTIDKVHFHEVGAIDTIIDIVGTILALRYLGVELIISSPLQTGRGFVECQHGTMPVPAPATAELLIGIPNYKGAIEKELLTPTGAALIKVLATEFGDLPENFNHEKIGYGAGTWDLEIPNAVRILLGTIDHNAEEKVYQMETNIDDMNPQLYSYVMDKLLDAGALDVWITPIFMKKSRPAQTLAVLIPENLLNIITEIILTETTSLGVRYQEVCRMKAERQNIMVDLPYGSARAKIAKYNGKIINISAEYEDCYRLAATKNMVLKRVINDVSIRAKEIADNLN